MWLRSPRDRAVEIAVALLGRIGMVVMLSLRKDFTPLHVLMLYYTSDPTMMHNLGVTIRSEEPHIQFKPDISCGGWRRYKNLHRN
jgi:hypothetical protein